ncbi:hypothetical protein U9M48_005968 [Paspalum notatum var. saurae]|uniref:Uncharacterized protein n=1 Tax=Paspalum notatum var. saurae TaxID=547442 RepID=A0AAQ3PWV1_PASNO
MAQRDNKQAAGGGGVGSGPGPGPGRGHVAMDLHLDLEEQRSAEPRAARWAAAAGVAGVGLAGAGVLVWWAVAFHPAHQQLWMVPVGLVLLGTPLLAWLSLFASGASRWLRRDHQLPAAVLPDNR